MNAGTKNGNYLHGMSRRPEHKAYTDAIARCTNARHDDYENYGGRGIGFRFDSFMAFFAVVGLKPAKRYRLDRINNDGHYEKGNIKWSTPEESNVNRRSRHGYKMPRYWSRRKRSTILTRG